MNDALNDETTGAPSAASEDAKAHEQRHESVAALADLRLRRIAEFQAEALAMSDAFQANLGAASGALLRIGYRLEEAIEMALTKVAVPGEQFDRLARAIETYLKVMRQVDRFGQLDQRLSLGRQVGALHKPR